ncbi:MAG: uroporphyrinogen decarboxylase family protein [Anaerolineae bacterium]
MSEQTDAPLEPAPETRENQVAEAEKLWADYRHGENGRVPITFASDEQLWLKVSGHSFRQFYADPSVHLKAQLQGRRWMAEHVRGDTAPGVPERWHVGVQLWMEENEFYGCEVQYQEDDFAWADPLPLSKDDLLPYLADLDPEDRVRRSSAIRMYEALRELADGMTYMDRPVHVAPPGRGCHGIFTKAAEIRGLERMCIDLQEDPDFAQKLLWLMTEKAVARMNAWRRIAPVEGEAPLPSPHWMLCDDSLQMISAATYERFVLPCHLALFEAACTGERSLHLCGRSWQHYEALRWKLGISLIDGPGPFVDHGRYLRDLGPGFGFNAQTDHSVLAYGSPADVDEMMRRLLSPEAKQPGRFNVVGYVARDTPLRNLEACYSAGLKYGSIGAGGHQQ